MFSAIQARKDRFGIFWIEKERFLDQKSEVLIQSTNNRSFPKGLVHAFCKKFELFIKFCRGQIKPEKVG